MKICSTCKFEKTEFYRLAEAVDGLQSRCKDCCRVAARAYRKTEKNREYNRAYRAKRGDHFKGYYADPEWQTYFHNKRLLRNYDISIDQYNQKFAEQAGCCKICGRHQTQLKKRLSVDHCHSSGKVRGLLCLQCNMVLGLVKDNMQILLSAANYLKENS